MSLFKYFKNLVSGQSADQNQQPKAKFYNKPTVVIRDTFTGEISLSVMNGHQLDNEKTQNLRDHINKVLSKSNMVDFLALPLDGTIHYKTDHREFTMNTTKPGTAEEYEEHVRQGEALAKKDTVARRIIVISATNWASKNGCPVDNQGQHPDIAPRQSDGPLNESCPR